MSNTFGDYSVSTTASPSTPLWTSLSSSNANNYSEGAPPSPASSHGTQTGGVISVVPSSPGGDLSYSDEEADDINKFKNEIDATRERRAITRALALLDDTAGSEVSLLARATSTPKPKPVLTTRQAATKRYEEMQPVLTAHQVRQAAIKRYEERRAIARALVLLDDTAGREVSELARATSMPKPKPAITTRQAATKRYEERQLLKAQIHAKLKEDRATYGKPTPTLVVIPGKETMAESTRRPRAKTAEDVRDPETVAGMKCQMDIEREKKAQKKALQLLNYGCIA
jgi:vacuolar-type H+-ATPase subunit F/Vma7